MYGFERDVGGISAWKVQLVEVEVDEELEPEFVVGEVPEDVIVLSVGEFVEVVAALVVANEGRAEAANATGRVVTNGGRGGAANTNSRCKSTTRGVFFIELTITSIS